MSSNHCEIVRDSLNGERAVDEQTFISLEILSERLERLKKHCEIFSSVTVSPAVESLAMQRDAMAVASNAG